MEDVTLTLKHVSPGVSRQLRHAMISGRVQNPYMRFARKTIRRTKTTITKTPAMKTFSFI
jgi:hypothetical protein